MSESWGIKVAIPGKDIETATPEECAVHSGYDTFKVNRHPVPAHYGAVNFTLTANPADNYDANVFELAHGYSYRPAFMVHMRNNTTGRVSVDSILTFSPSGTGFYAYMTNTKFIVNFRRSNDSFLSPRPDYTGTTVTIRYYIFAENGN